MARPPDTTTPTEAIATPTAPAEDADAGASVSPVPSDPTSTPASGVAGARCGVERWAVKTLSDVDVGEVEFGPQATSVQTLRSLTAPATLPKDHRIGMVERQVYSVPVTLVKMKLENDHDVHLVVAAPDDPSLTMIVEFPDVACQGAGTSAHTGEMAAARDALTAACGVATRSFRTLHGTGTVTGVAFFDFLHGQTGVAPNGVELHPVIGFDGHCD